MKIKIDMLDRIFSKLVRKRDLFTCRRCGKQHEENSMGLHCSHYFGRANKSTRYDFENCDALCWGCHQRWETMKVTEYKQFKVKQLGEKRYNELERRARTPIQFGEYERKIKYEELKSLL